MRHQFLPLISLISSATMNFVFLLVMNHFKQKLFIIVIARIPWVFTLSLCQIFYILIFWSLLTCLIIFSPMWQLIDVSTWVDHWMPRYPVKHCCRMYLWGCFQESLAFELVDWIKQTALPNVGAPPVAQTVKNLPAMLETWLQSVGHVEPLEKVMATHSSTLAWRIP